jgi:hypothetical protein
MANRRANRAPRFRRAAAPLAKISLRCCGGRNDEGGRFRRHLAGRGTECLRRGVPKSLASWDGRPSGRGRLHDSPAPKGDARPTVARKATHTGSSTHCGRIGAISRLNLKRSHLWSGYRLGEATIMIRLVFSLLANSVRDRPRWRGALSEPQRCEWVRLARSGIESSRPFDRRAPMQEALS